MKGKVVWFVISFLMGRITSLYFHEPSVSLIVDKVGQNELRGYSLGYQKQQQKLVLGSPNTATGKIYTCPKSAIFGGESCDSINEIDSTLKNGRKATDDYKYMLGASIAILNNSFVTCAPMWSGEYSFSSNTEMGKKVFFVWGACFEVKNEIVTPLTGLYGHPREVKATQGSFGWRTLVDDTNNLLLISKPASPELHGDIAYVNINEREGLGEIKSLVLDDILKSDENKTLYRNMFRKYRNLGTALASGKFWHLDNIVYAFGFTKENLDGGVMFLKYAGGKLLPIKSEKPLQLFYYDDRGLTPKNIMFGAALCGAKLYGDSYTDLVVGAPAHHGTEASNPELGAIHIYKGSLKKDHFIRNIKLSIMGVNEGSRFGSSIVANDLDGDGFQELYVSAPYFEDGVVYILSGYEISKLLKDTITTLDVSALEKKQIIKKEGFKRLGFSVIDMTDLDDNGCNEIAIGAPESNKVLILRCIPTVKIEVTSEIVGLKKIPETVNKFQINVCINMDYKSNMNKIAASVSLANTISGTQKTRVKITCDPNLVSIDISSKEKTYCRPINVSIVGNQPGSYIFKSEAKLITEGLEKKEFDPSWVRESPFSKMSRTQHIERGCSGEDCNYNLKMEFLWSGGEGHKYSVGSMKDEILTLRITNEGRIAFTACALVNVVGAPVDQLDCSHNSEGYLCRLPAGFMKNTSRDIQIKLRTSKLTNEYTGLNVTANLYDDCEDKKSPVSKQYQVEYEFITDTIEVQGTSETRSITEKSMKTSSETIDVTHVYKISNKGTILWKAVEMAISIKETNFIKELVVTSEKLQCKTMKQNASCTFDLIPSTTIKIVVTAIVWKKQIEKPLLNNIVMLTITSNLSLTLVPTSVIKNGSVTSAPVYEKDTTFAQNKTLIIIIAILVAVIFFGIVIYILYRTSLVINALRPGYPKNPHLPVFPISFSSSKQLNLNLKKIYDIIGDIFKLGFFRRKQKEELQAEIRRRSVKRPDNTTSQHEDSLIELNDDEINDDEDSLISKRASNRSMSKKMSETENPVAKEEKSEST